jgi:hypothetical protein
MVSSLDAKGGRPTAAWREAVLQMQSMSGTDIRTTTPHPAPGTTDIPSNDRSIDREFRRAMRSSARFTSTRVHLARFPQWAAGLLHEQPNEWSLIAFARAEVVSSMAMNEGSRSQATSWVSMDAVVGHARRMKSDLLVFLHNHPVSHAERRSGFDGLTPSATDYDSAERLARALDPLGTAILAMLCVGGLAYEFFWRIPAPGPRQLSMESIPGFTTSAPEISQLPRAADGRFIERVSPWAKIRAWPLATPLEPRLSRR